MTILTSLRYLISLPFRLVRRINHWALAEPQRPGDLEVRFQGSIFQNQANVSVGERVFIGKGCLIIAAKAKITIGSDTMIAPRVIITTATHDPAQNPMWKTAISRPIIIGRHVWIGLGAIVLPGVKIGDSAIIGAGAVVSRHVPEGAVVVGNPARISHYREVPPLDTVTQGRYPYWEDIYDDYLPPDKITNKMDTNS